LERITIAYRKEQHGCQFEGYALLIQGQQCNSIGAVKLTAVRFFSIGYIEKEKEKILNNRHNFFKQ
jgi:hypothetical protein